jgi:hypothetical protein
MAAELEKPQGLVWAANKAALSVGSYQVVISAR